MKHNLLSPTVKSYGALSVAIPAILCVGSRISGIGLPALMVAKVAFLAGTYYLSPYVIKAQYTMFHNARGVASDGLVDRAVSNIKNAKNLQKDWKDVEVYEYEGDEANAFAIGVTKKTAAVYVSSGLLKAFKSIEGEPRTKELMLEAVLAHEFGHITGRHSWISFISRAVDIVGDGVLTWLDSKAKQENEEGGRSEKKDEKKKESHSVTYYAAYATLVLFKTFGVSYISRQNEYMADNFAVQLGYGDNLKKALCAIHGTTEGELENKPNFLYGCYTWAKECFASHPTCKNRIIAIKNADVKFKVKDVKGLELIKSAVSDTLNTLYAENMSHFRGLQDLQVYERISWPILLKASLGKEFLQAPFSDM